MDKRKTGIALFITLMVIASIMSIMAVSFSYLEKVQKDSAATSAIIQANILYGNTIDKLKQIFPPKGDHTQKFALFYNMPIPISEEKSGFLVTLTCEPLMVAVPINWLDPKVSPKTPTKNSLARDVFSYVVELYEIKNPNELEALLLQNITGKRNPDDEYIARVKKQKGIVSKEQFNRLVTDYALRYDDDKALQVPWEKYFTFIKVNSKTKIDGTFPSAEFVSAAFDIPLDLVKEDWINDVTTGEITTLSSFLSDNSYMSPLEKKIYSKKAINAMHCEERFAYQERQYKFNFNYIKGRSSNFEFNGQE